MSPLSFLILFICVFLFFLVSLTTGLSFFINLFKEPTFDISPPLELQFLISLIYALIFIISFLLFTWDLNGSSCSGFLRWELRRLVSDLSSFLLYAFNFKCAPLLDGQFYCWGSLLEVSVTCMPRNACRGVCVHSPKFRPSSQMPTGWGTGWNASQGIQVWKTAEGNSMCGMGTLSVCIKREGSGSWYVQHAK